MTLLKVSEVTIRYGPVLAVDRVSLAIEEGEIVSLVGTNGAGKSSLLKSIMGIVPISSGAIESPKSRAISGHKSHWVARNCSFAYVAEDRNIFTRLTVEENIELGAFTLRGNGKQWVKTELANMYEFFPKLKERRSQVAGTLSGGEQQMVVMARALISKPKLLLLDEPSLGLAPLIVADIFSRLETVRSAGTSILLVEQNSQIAFKVSSRAYVMEQGHIVLEGTGKDLSKDDRVRKAYLGQVSIA